MAKYSIPRCVAEYPDSRGNYRVCNEDMRAMGEREPSFGPNWRPGTWVFQCKYCGSVRAIDAENAGRYAEKIR
jgi:hypothetical protein